MNWETAVNALEMKLIAMKFALARKGYIPNDAKFTSSSGAYDVGMIQQQLSQGIVIDDRDLIITNTIVEDCEHDANVAATATTQNNVPSIPELDHEPQNQVSTEVTTEAQPVHEPVVEEINPPIAVTATEPQTQPEVPNQSFGGRIWQYFKDTTNVQPKS